MTGGVDGGGIVGFAYSKSAHPADACALGFNRLSVLTHINIHVKTALQ